MAATNTKFILIKYLAGHEKVDAYQMIEETTEVVSVVTSTKITLYNLDGTLVTDSDGVFECEVINANPPKPSWAI